MRSDAAADERRRAHGSEPRRVFRGLELDSHPNEAVGFAIPGHHDVDEVGIGPGALLGMELQPGLSQDLRPSVPRTMATVRDKLDTARFG